MVTVRELFDLKCTLAEEYLKCFVYPWEALKRMPEAIAAIGRTLNEDYLKVREGVWVHVKAKVACSALILPPAIICEGAEVRHCAYVRGSALIGRGCVAGNSTELKNVILFDGAALPHFNYAGDGIIGCGAHLGAGAITSNVKSDKGLVTVHGGEEYRTGRKKVGAFIGDGAEVGCNSVLNPGTVVGKNTIIYPLSSVRGVIPPNAIFKHGEIYFRR